MKPTLPPSAAFYNSRVFHLRFLSFRNAYATYIQPPLVPASSKSYTTTTSYYIRPLGDAPDDTKDYILPSPPLSSSSPPYLLLRSLWKNELLLKKIYTRKLCFPGRELVPKQSCWTRVFKLVSFILLLPLLEPKSKLSSPTSIAPKNMCVCVCVCLAGWSWSWQHSGGSMVLPICFFCGRWWWCPMTLSFEDAS